MHKKIYFFGLLITVSVLSGFLVSSLTAEANFLNDLFSAFRKEDFESTKTINSPQKIEPYQSPIDYEEAIILAVEKSSPAVISIIVTKDLPIIENCPFNPFGNLPPEFRDFFGRFEFEEPCETGTRREEVGGGSGFIVSQDGYIVTNKHVVSDTKAEYTVLTNDGKRYSAKVLARNPVQDLAIVKIDPEGKNLSTVALGDSDSIRLGQTAIAIGNALGEFRNTVSVGIVSGLSRAVNASNRGEVEHLEGLIQTDAAINPGNSGGPLLNLRGEVIGINTAVAENAENIGFSIPVNNVKQNIKSVRETGKITIPFLGVRYIAVTSDFAERENLSVHEGVLIRGSEEGPGVILNSPAHKAGLRAEDIIIEMGGEKITLERSLASLIQRLNVGDKVTLVIVREGKRIQVSVTLDERKSE